MTTKTRGWPEERRKAQAERCRKQRPWENATGPKTPEGKTKVAQNAYKHGFRSRPYRMVYHLLRLQKAFVKRAVKEAYLNASLRETAGNEAIQSHEKNTGLPYRRSLFCGPLLQPKLRFTSRLLTMTTPESLSTGLPVPKQLQNSDDHILCDSRLPSWLNPLRLVTGQTGRSRRHPQDRLRQYRGDQCAAHRKQETGGRNPPSRWRQRGLRRPFSAKPCRTGDSPQRRHAGRPVCRYRPHVSGLAQIQGWQRCGDNTRYASCLSPASRLKRLCGLAFNRPCFSHLIACRSDRHAGKSATGPPSLCRYRTSGSLQPNSPFHLVQTPQQYPAPDQRGRA